MAGHLALKPSPAVGEVVNTVCCGRQMVVVALMGPAQYTLSGVDCDSAIFNDPDPGKHDIVVCDPLPTCPRCKHDVRPKDNYCPQCSMKLR